MADKKPLKKRMVENEAVFRSLNEHAQRSHQALKDLARETGQEDLVETGDNPLHFYCECSDEDCRQRILIAPSRYDKIHERRDQFVVVCGHEVPAVEHIVDHESEFCVVEEYETPPDNAWRLAPTNVNN